MRIRKIVLLAIFFVLCGLRGYGAVPDSTRIVITSPNVSPEIKTEVYRMFEGIGSAPVMRGNTDPIIIPTVVLADSTLEKRSYADALLDKVTQAQRFKETLSSLSEIDLPVGIVKSGGSVDYSILIDRMTFTTKGAMMEVYASLALKTGDRIAFNGKVPLSSSGGIAGTARIFLVGDYTLKLNESSQITLKGINKNTFVEFDCNGFVGIGVEAEVEFSRDFIVPEDKDGNVIPGDKTPRVKVDINTYAQSLNNMMVGVTIPSFQVAHLKGFSFTVTNATLDWSDTRNPSTLVFPSGYTSPAVEAGQPLLWQGFYLDHLEVRLPPGFAKKQDNNASGDAASKRILIEVDHMILDDEGFSGKISVSPVISLGDMSGWSYSIDTLGLEFVTNQVKGFELGGKLTIPVIKGKDGKPTQFGYLAERGADGNYIFSVTVENELTFPLFVADLNLFKGSSVVVKERDGKFYPTASLNGEISIKAAKAVFNSLRFEGLKISSEDPQFDIEAIGFGKEGSTQSMSKFPLVINNIMLRKEDNRIGIGFDVTINIAGNADEGGFGGTAALTVWGKRERETVTAPNGTVVSTQTSNWKFDKVEVSGIGVNFKKAGVIEIAGMIRFFEDDPVYGDGFKGSVSGKIQIISLQVEALFGKTPQYRYWFADAKVEFESGLPLSPGISIYGFGGGFYSKMKQSTGGGISSPLGETASGVTYVPDENTMGIKALVKFGCTGSQMPYNGDVALEVQLNRSGGINSVTFTGNLHVMTPPPIVQTALAAKQMIAAAINSKDGEGLENSDPAQGAVSAHVKIFFDNVNHIFHANMEMYVSVVGGIIKGVGAGNRAGWAVMHFEPDDWYVLIGTPSDPVGLEILWTFKMKSYFMMGKHLPGSPPPPSQVSDILGITAADLDYMRDLNAIESGLGFAFGMNMSFDTGDLTFLMFYARFAAGLGTDFMIKQYSKAYHCAGSDGPIGINGWYANGQAYAYVQGKIGIRVHLTFYKGNFDILSIGAAAVLQAKGPNPFWLHGIVGGYYRILGGLVSGHCKFEMTVGKSCEIVGESNPLDDVKIIAQVSPANNLTDVDVFSAPQVAFNIPVGKVFDITDKEDKKHSYRASLDEFAVYDGQNLLPGSLQWNDDADVVIFNGRDILPGEKKIRVHVSLTFEENVNGGWSKVKFDGQIVRETKDNEFQTGKAPDYIPNSNVSVSYPITGQINFYPKEYDQGFIQLKQGQAYLFKVGPEWKQKMRMTNVANDSYLESDFAYSEADKKISFVLPSGFQNASVYHFEILNIPLHSTVVDANVQKVQTEVGGGENGTATLTTKTIEGNLANLEVKSIYTSSFRTSRYNTFAEKMATIRFGQTFRNLPVVALYTLSAYLSGNENFDEVELKGGDAFGPMVTLEADLQGNNWYENYVYPLVYDGYPLLGKLNLRVRDKDVFGLPPVRNFYYNNLTLNNPVPSNTEEFNALAKPFVNEELIYNMAESVNMDYYDLRNQAANYMVDHPAETTPRLQRFILENVPMIRSGVYKVRFQYRIPTVNRTTSGYEMQFVNTVPDN